MPSAEERAPETPRLARAARDLAGAARAVGGVFEALAPRSRNEPYDRGRAEELGALAEHLESAAADVVTTDRRLAGELEPTDRARLALRAFDEAYDLSNGALSVLRLAAVAVARTEEDERARVRELGARARQVLEQVHAEALERAARVEDSRDLELRRRVLDVHRVEGDALLGEL